MKGMDMDPVHHSGTSLRDPPAAANEPAPGAPGPTTKHSGRFLPPARYRHPGDVIRLIGSGLVLTAMLAAVAVAPGRLTGAGAATVTWLGSDPAGRLLTGLVQVGFVAAAAGAVAVACPTGGSDPRGSPPRCGPPACPSPPSSRPGW